MSVNVFDENDVTVRQLACAQPSDQPVTWDGRDQYGRWVKPGQYRYHGLIAPKLSLRYVTSIGQSGNPPYRTADGTGSWGGVWGYVMDVCPIDATPDADIVVLWAIEEGEGGLIRMSQDGAVRWKQHLEWWMKAQQMAVTSDGESIYIAAASALDAPAGQSNYGGAMNRPLLWRVDAATGAKRPFPGTDPQHQRMFGRYLRGERIVTDVAVSRGKVYLTAPAQDTLFVADAATGRQLAAWPIKQVSGLVVDAGGRLLAGSGSKIVQLDDQGKVVATLADAGGPIWDLKAAPSGELVASVGSPRQQVVYFSPGGKEVRSLGSRGGRPKCGKMQPASFRDPVGLCITGNGKLFAAESACAEAIHAVVGGGDAGAPVPRSLLLQRHVRHRRGAARARLRRHAQRFNPLRGRLRNRPMGRGPLLDRRLQGLRRTREMVAADSAQGRPGLVVQRQRRDRRIAGRPRAGRGGRVRWLRGEAARRELSACGSGSTRA